jgi:hypothetical protein
MITLAAKPNEGSAYIITVDFLDINGDPFTPLTCLWSLTDMNGAVINSRSKVAITVVGTSTTIVLSGLDLKYAIGTSAGLRVFTVEGTYNSVYGNNLPFREEAQFEILDTVINA